MDERRWGHLHDCAETLMLWNSVLKTPVGAAFLRLITALASGQQRPALRSYAALTGALAQECTRPAGQSIPSPSGDAWQSYVLERMLADENPFTRATAQNGAAELPAGLARMAASDLRGLEALYRTDAETVRAAIVRLDGDASADVHAGLPAWRELGQAPATAVPPIATLLDRTTGWDAPEVVRAIAEHIARAGSGLLGRYRAFRWVHGEHNTRSPLCLPLDFGALWAVPHPDPIRLDDLVGYAPQRRLLLQNTEHFLAGAPANNVLLYGDRGTGKSASVKALLNEYGDRGLRLIEIAKTDLVDLPHLLAALRPRRERFIIFVDDLSFEHHETHYKDLKVLLEGSLEARPPNVALYATSNRRHLVQERFSDRGSPRAMASAGGPGLFGGGADELHAQDTLQEKLSMSDRFGLALTYATPLQAEYLEIVETLAARAGLTIPQETLRQRALAWATQHNGRSGRAARQLVDFLIGEALVGR